MSRKRSSFLSTSESDDDGVPSKRAKGINWDPYCWLCHQGNTNRGCSTCIRSYHDYCIGIKEVARSKSDFQCELCIRIETAREDYNKRNVNMEEINKMLSHVTTRLQEDKDFRRFKGERHFAQLRRPDQPGPNIINPFDLDIVMEKVEHSNYMTTLEFINDIIWIRHNAEILLKDTDNRLEHARNMEKLCDLEVYDIEMCGECFHRASEDPDNWFTEVCSPPHLIVWARTHGHPYWPAKVIGFGDAGNNKIDVRFFKTHERQNILVSDCLLFSTNPNKKFHKEIDDAVKEAEKYLKNIESKYSCVVKRPTRSQFNISQIGKYLKDMIPGLELPNDFKLKRKPSYLRKYRPRKGVDKAKYTKSSVKEGKKKIIKTRGCEVRLERCDDMIERILSRQAGKKKNQQGAGPQRECEAIEEVEEEAGSKGSENDVVEENVVESIESISVEKPPTESPEKEMDENHLAEGEKHGSDEDPNEENDDEMTHCSEIELKQEDPAQDEYEHYRRAVEHINKYDLVINLSSDSNDSIMCFNVSSDDEMEVDEPPNSQQSNSEDINTKSSNVNQNPIEITDLQSPEYEPLNVTTPCNKSSDDGISSDDSRDKAASNDEEELTCRKDPAPRTYERHNKRRTTSGAKSIQRFNKPISRTKFVARKSYTSTHTQNLAIRRAAIKNYPESVVPVASSGEPNVDCTNDTSKSDEGDNQNMHSVVVPSLFEDLDDGGLFRDTGDPLSGVSDPFSDAGLGIEPQSHSGSEVTSQTHIEVDEEDVEGRKEEKSEPEITPNTSTDAQANPNDTSNMDCVAEVDSKSGENEKQPDEIIESEANVEVGDSEPTVIENDENEENGNEDTNFDNSEATIVEVNENEQKKDEDINTVENEVNSQIDQSIDQPEPVADEPESIADQPKAKPDAIVDQTKAFVDQPKSVTNQTESNVNQSDEREHKELPSTENQPIIVTPTPTPTSAINEGVVTAESTHNPLPQSSTVENESSCVEDEASTIAMDTTVIDQPLGNMFQMLKENIKPYENLIQSQRVRLVEKEKQISDLLAQLAQRNEVQSQLNKEISKLRQDRDAQIQKVLDQQASYDKTILKLKTDYEAQIQKAIEETKSQDWCPICKREALMKHFKPPVCSQECLRQLWQNGKDSSDITAQDQTDNEIHVNGQVLVSSNARNSTLNGNEDSSHMDDLSFSEIREY